MATEQLVKPSRTKPSQPRDACTTGGTKSRVTTGPAAAHALSRPGRMPADDLQQRHAEPAARKRAPDSGQPRSAAAGGQHGLVPQKSAALGVKVEATASPQQDAGTSGEARMRSQQSEAPAATTCIGAQQLTKSLATTDGCAPHRVHLHNAEKCLAMHRNSSSRGCPKALKHS